MSMSDLIRREDVITVLCFCEETKMMLCKELRKILEKINKIPSAEPERKKGEWIDEKINSYTSRTYCSECGSTAPFDYEADDYYGVYACGETTKTKFCPNCGADMRGEHERPDQQTGNDRCNASAQSSIL